MAIIREVRQRRTDRPWEMWKGQLELAGEQQVIRCGVCLKGLICPELGAKCGECGATITHLFYTDRPIPQPPR